MTAPIRPDPFGILRETPEQRSQRQRWEELRRLLGMTAKPSLTPTTMPDMTEALAAYRRPVESAFDIEAARTLGIQPDITATPRPPQRRTPTLDVQREAEPTGLSKLANILAQPVVQPMLAGQRFREAVETTPLGAVTPTTPGAMRRSQEAISERFGPKSTAATIAAVPSAFAGEAVPYIAAGGGIPGLLRSAAITGVTSRRPGGSTVEALGELSGSETLKRLAESPYRTAADVALDVGMNVLPGAIGGLTRGFGEAAAVTRGGVGTTRALARQAGRNIAAGVREIGPTLRAVGQQAMAEPLTTAALAGSMVSETAAPGAGLLAAALPATTRNKSPFVRMAEEGISARPTLPSESRAFETQGYIEPPKGYRAANNLLGEKEHRDNVRSIVLRVNPGGIFDGTTQTTGFGLYGDVSPNTITRWTLDTDDSKVRRTASVLGLIEGQQAQMPHRLARQGDELMASDGMSGRTKGYVMTGPDEGPLTPDDAMALLSIAQRNGLAGGTFDEQTGRVYFINIKGLSGQSDKEFLRSVSKVAEDAGDALPIRIEDGDLYAEYIDGPSRYLSILGDNIEDVRNARNVLDLVAPEYERFAESIGADVTKTRDRLAATRALLDGRIDAIARAEGPLGQMQRELAGVKDETVEIAASRALDDTKARLKARRDKVPVDLSSGTPAQRQMRAIKLGLDDLRDAVKRFGKSASEWYSKQGQQASAQMQTLIPELRGSPEKRFVANTILALTSSGATVEDNLARALPIIRQYIKTGQITQLDVSRGIQNAETMGPLMAEQVGKKRVRQGVWPTDLKGSTRAQAVESGLRKLQLFLDANGGDEKAVRDFFQQTYKTNVGDIPTSADVFGPKVGRFLMNVEGIGGEVTVDSWALRTWMRWMGYGDDARLTFDKEAVTKENPQGLVLRSGPTPEENAEIRESFTRLAKQISKETGENFDPADVQALLWYLEKFNYGKWGSKSELESFADVGNRFVMAGREPMPQMSSVAGTPFRFEFGAGPTTSGLERKATKDYLTQRGSGFRTYDITGAVPEALRQTFASPATTALVGGAVGAAQDEENRIGGFVRGAVIAPIVVGGGRASLELLKARKDLRMLGLPADLARAYTIAREGIDFGGAAARTAERYRKGGWRGIFRGAYDTVTNAARQLQKLGEREVAAGIPLEATVKTAVDHALSSDVTAARAIMGGIGREQGGLIHPITREIMGEPLEAIFKPFGKNYEEVKAAFTYAIAKRFTGRYDAAVAAGDANALRVYGGNAERLAADQQIVQGFNTPKFNQFTDRIEQYFDNLAQYAVASGMWTPEQANAIRASDSFYIPIKRIIESVQTRATRPMRGGVTPGTVTSGVQRFVGSNLMIGDPAETIAEYTQALIRRADMYRLGERFINATQALGETAAVTPISRTDALSRAAGIAEAKTAYQQTGLDENDAELMADMWRGVDIRNPVIWRNGPNGREYFLINDPDYLMAIQSFAPQNDGAMQAIVKVLSTAKRIATASLTSRNPAFILGVNIPRDILTAAAQNPDVTLQDAAVGFYEALKSIAGRSDVVEQLSRSGAGQVSQFGGDVDVAALMRQIAPTSASDVARAEFARFAGAPLRAIERVGRASEMPMRIAAARAAGRRAEQAGATALGKRAAESQAYSAATVDFRQRSGNALDRLLERTVAFYGVSKRGPAALASAMRRNPKMIPAVAGVVSLAAVYEFVNASEDERKQMVERQAQERARYLYYGKTRIALPQELAPLVTATRLGLAQFAKDDPYAFQQFKESLWNTAPVIAEDVLKMDFAAAMTPFPVARQILELSRNRSAFTGQPIISEYQMRQLPEARRTETTAPTFDVLAQAARAVGAEEASPLQAEYLARGLFGKFTPFITAATDVLAAPLAGRAAQEMVPLPISRAPFNPMASFVVQPVVRGQSELEYGKLRTQFERAFATVNRFEKAFEAAAERNDAVGQRRVLADINRLRKNNPVIEAAYQDGLVRSEIAELERQGREVPESMQMTSRRVIQDAADVMSQYYDARDVVISEFVNKQLTAKQARAELDRIDGMRAGLFQQFYSALRQRVPQ